VDTLKGHGPFTVFAPTDDAFERQQPSAMQRLLKDVPRLKNVLLYHVVSGKMMAEDIAKLKSVKTLQYQELKIEPPKGLFRKNIKVNFANIVAKDTVASNGVIHAIDEVLFPNKQS
jgi:uncharacterized surface protein with fasciclin (FAS1) repeats